MMPHFAAFWFFVILTVCRQVLYFKHQQRQKKNFVGNILQTEDRVGSKLLALLYTTIWLSTTYLLYLEFSQYFYVFGIILVIIGIAIRMQALRDLGSSYGHEIVIQKNHLLVTKGIYSWIRHPLYLGLGIELLGMILIAKNEWVLIAWILLIAVLVRRAFLEDAALTRSLGNAARQYQRSIPGVNVFFWLLRGDNKDVRR